MKKLVEEVEGEGLVKLLGQRVVLLCAAYFYEGKLVGVNDNDLILSDPYIVYGAGEWDKDSDYPTKERIAHVDEWYVRIDSIESYGRSRKQ